jgi:1-acyl-sn-glycerol-3-phosphate acyltransferase
MARKSLLALKSAVVVPLFLLFTIVISAIFLLVMAIRLRRIGEGIIQMWAHLFLLMAPVRWEVEGTENVVPGDQYFFLANHLSNFDIPLLFRAIPTPIRFLAKKELYKIPVLAQALHVAGMVKIDRGAGARSYTAINEGVAQAKESGYSIIVFPEGTRSRDGTMGAFKKGAFRMAITTGLAIVPVTLHGTWEVWPPGSKVFHRGRARVVIHPPIETAHLDIPDAAGLRDQTYEIINGQFDRLRHQS